MKKNYINNNIYEKNSKSTCTSVFIAALFMIAKIQSNLNVNEQINKQDMINARTHTIQYYSSIKNEKFVICSNMNRLGRHYVK